MRNNFRLQNGFTYFLLLQLKRQKKGSTIESVHLHLNTHHVYTENNSNLTAGIKPVLAHMNIDTVKRHTNFFKLLNL